MTDRILAEVLAERVRQHRLWGDQSHLPMGTSDAYREQAEDARYYCERATDLGTLTFWHILAEEVAEVRCETDPARLRTELIQVMAVCLQMVQAIDKKAASDA